MGAGALASVLDLLQVGQGELPLPPCLADSLYGVRFLSTSDGERIWNMRGCWAIRLVAFLLKSVNLVNCIVQLLLTLKPPYGTKITHYIACAVKGFITDVQGCLSD